MDGRESPLRRDLAIVTTLPGAGSEIFLRAPSANCTFAKKTREIAKALRCPKFKWVTNVERGGFVMKPPKTTTLPCKVRGTRRLDCRRVRFLATAGLQLNSEKTLT